MRNYLGVIASKLKWNVVEGIRLTAIGLGWSEGLSG